MEIGAGSWDDSVSGPKAERVSFQHEWRDGKKILVVSEVCH